MIFDFFDSPELLEIQRTGFFHFLNQGIPQLLAKEFPIKVRNGSYSLELSLNENNVKLIAPEDNPRDCILKMKTYNCKLYAQVKIVCKTFSSFENKEKTVYQSLPEWVLLGQLPMMTKRGHFIINGSPRVIVHQVVRSPGIYFQKLMKKDDQNLDRFYGDIIPLKGVWVRLQMNKKGRVEAKFKKGKKVEVELLEKCLQVIENQTFFRARPRFFVRESFCKARFCTCFGQGFRPINLQSKALHLDVLKHEKLCFASQKREFRQPGFRQPEFRQPEFRQPEFRQPSPLRDELRLRSLGLGRLASYKAVFCKQAGCYARLPVRAKTKICNTKGVGAGGFATKICTNPFCTGTSERRKSGVSQSVALQKSVCFNPSKEVAPLLLYDDYSKLLNKKKSKAESKAEHDAFIHTYDKLYRTIQDKELEEWQKKKRNQNFFKGLCSLSEGSSGFALMAPPSSIGGSYKSWWQRVMPLSFGINADKICNSSRAIGGDMKLPYKSSICNTEGDRTGDLSSCKAFLSKPLHLRCTTKISNTNGYKLFTSSKICTELRPNHLYGKATGGLSPLVKGQKFVNPTRFTEGDMAGGFATDAIWVNSGKNGFSDRLLDQERSPGNRAEEGIESLSGLKEKSSCKSCIHTSLQRNRARGKRGTEHKPENTFKRKKCSESLFASFKNNSRYDLGILGRERINNRFGSELQPRSCIAFTSSPSLNTQLTAQDLCRATVWLYRLRKGEESTDDIDHSQNRRVRSSGELLQTQFENGVSRLTSLLSTKLQEWRGDVTSSAFSSIFKRSFKTRSVFKASFARHESSGYHLKKEIGSRDSYARTCVHIKQNPDSLLTCGAVWGHMILPYKSSLQSKASPLGTYSKEVSTKGERFVRRWWQSDHHMALVAKQPSDGIGGRAFYKSFTGGDKICTAKPPISYKLSTKELFSTKPITGALREFFGSNPLSQYMDQTNPLAEITHKRRMSSLGIGGVSRESAGMAIRGIHPTHYGRICPIETPEGKNAGLVNSLAFYTKIDRNGFLKTPYYRVFKGQIQSSLGFSFCSAREELLTGLQIAPSDLQKSRNNVLRTRLPLFALPQLPFGENQLRLQSQGQWPREKGAYTEADKEVLQFRKPVLESSTSNRKALTEEESCITKLPQSVPVRVADNLLDVFKKENPYRVSLIAISPIQMISVATSLIPFLEHNDANRALMGSNMQRQAVPLMISERPIVGTGLESTVIVESGHLTESQISGFASHVSANKVIVDRLLYRKGKKEGGSSLSLARASHVRVNGLPCSLLSETRALERVTQHLVQNSALCVKLCKRDRFRSPSVSSFCLVAKPPSPSPSAKAQFCTKGKSTKDDKICTSLPLKRSRIRRVAQRYKTELSMRGGNRRETTQKHSFLVSRVSSLTTFSRSNQNTSITEKPLLREFDWVQKGDIVTDCSASNDGELAVGKNVLLAYIPWEGYNFEDAIVISERLVREHVYTSLHIERYVFQAQELRDGAEWFTKHLPGVQTGAIQHLEESGLPKIGSFLKEGDIIVGKIRHLNKKPSSPYERLLCDILGEKSFAARNKSLYVPKGVRARVVYHKVISVFDNDPENRVRPIDAAKTVHLFLGEKRVIQVGDKISGRHGNKGVISTILPTQDMPYLPDGTPIDIVLNPLGVPSRMNVGQVLECLLGLAASYLNQHFKIASFDERYGVEASKSIVFLKLYQARLLSGQNWLFQVAFPGKTRLVDGRSGECFDQWITVGRAYILKLIHMVSEKIHARSTGPYALITQQPLRGRSNKGGQRLGEMEVWALEGFGAAYTLQELLTKKSDDFFGRKQIVDSILPDPASIVDTLQPSNRIDKNKNVLGHPEIFKVLLCELQALCLDLGVYIVTPDSFQRSFLGRVH